MKYASLGLFLINFCGRRCLKLAPCNRTALLHESKPATVRNGHNPGWYPYFTLFRNHGAEIRGLPYGGKRWLPSKGHHLWCLLWAEYRSYTSYRGVTQPLCEYKASRRLANKHIPHLCPTHTTSTIRSVPAWWCCSTPFFSFDFSRRGMSSIIPVLDISTNHNLRCTGW